MATKTKKRAPRAYTPDRGRVMVQVPTEGLRDEWQAEADAAAGVAGAPLGPWIRAMVQRGRRAGSVRR